MLRFFRSGGIAQIVVGGIVFAIIAVFALEFRAGRGPTAALEAACAVEYGGHCVDPKEYGAAYSLIAFRGLDPKQAKAMTLRRRTLEGLAERELLVAAAEKEGLGVSDDAVEEQLTAGRAHVSLPAEHAQELAQRLGLCRYSENGACEPQTPLGVRQLRVKRSPGEPFDYQLYEREVRILTNRGPKEFREMQERELLAHRMRELVRSRVRVPESEARLLFERGRTRAVIRSTRLEQSWFMKHAVDHSREAVETWAAANAAQVDEAWKADQDKYSAGCPLVREIMVQVSPLALDEEKAPLRQKIEEARSRVQKGEAFEAVARELSDAPSAAFGGEVGCLNASYGMGADELLKAAAGLKQGELSAVIETPRGFHVIEVTGKLDAAEVATEGRFTVARNLYARFAAEEAARKFGERLIDLVKAGNKLEDATNELARTVLSERAKTKAGAKKKDEEPAALKSADRPKFEISPPFNVSGNPLPDLEPREPLATRAFELKAADEVYQKPIATATGFVVIQLKERTEASPEEFEKEKWVILRALRQAKGNDALARYVGELKAAAGDKLKVDGSFGAEPKSADEQ